MSDCPHGFPSPLSCVDCMYEGNLPLPAPKPPVTVVSRFTAIYCGWCRSCDGGIEPGDKIAKMSDESYRHSDCVK